MAQRSLTSPPQSPAILPVAGRSLQSSPSSSSKSSSTKSSGSKADRRVELEVKTLVTKLKRRDINGSFNCAMATATLFRTIVDISRFATVQQLMDCIRSSGKKLVSARRVELTIGNITRRVLYIIRQELASLLASGSADIADQQHSVDLSASLHKILDNRSQYDFAQQELNSELRRSIIQELTEMIEEIKTVKTTIADQAIEHIHSKEVVMTFGRSHTVMEFLIEAARFRKFEVFCAEAAPSFQGQHMSVMLAENDIDTTLITDSAIFAMMSRCNKVIVGTHAVLANGGLVAPIGTLNLVVSAHYHKVPVVVVSGIYKLSPLYAFDQDTFNEHKSPADILEFDKEVAEFCTVENPAFDYVPPEYVDLFVTNLGGHNPSYIYRLLAEYYNSDDYEL